MTVRGESNSARYRSGGAVEGRRLRCGIRRDCELVSCKTPLGTWRAERLADEMIHSYNRALDGKAQWFDDRSCRLGLIVVPSRLGGGFANPRGWGGLRTRTATGADYGISSIP